MLKLWITLIGAVVLLLPCACAEWAPRWWWTASAGGWTAPDADYRPAAGA